MSLPHVPSPATGGYQQNTLGEVKNLIFYSFNCIFAGFLLHYGFRTGFGKFFRYPQSFFFWGGGRGWFTGAKGGGEVNSSLLCTALTSFVFRWRSSIIFSVPLFCSLFVAFDDYLFFSCSMWAYESDVKNNKTEQCIEVIKFRMNWHIIRTFKATFLSRINNFLTHDRCLRQKSGSRLHDRFSLLKLRSLPKMSSSTTASSSTVLLSSNKGEYGVDATNGQKHIGDWKLFK